MSLKRLASAALAASVLAFVSGVANAAPQPAVTAGANVEAPQPAVTAGKGTVTITPPAIAATPVGGGFPVTASVGVVSREPRGESLDSMIAEADRAMYAAKAAGRNCVVMAT